jgi:hypothetical protein
LTEIVNDDVSEAKSFGFEKPKTKTYLLSFRMDKQHNDLLQNLFTVLEIKPKKDTITNRMLMLIDRAEAMRKTILDYEKSIEALKNEYHGKIEALKKEKQALENKIRLYEKEKADLEKEAKKMVLANKISMAKPSQINIPKPTQTIPGKSESVTPIQVTQKPIDDWVWCPTIEDWRHNKECGQCKFPIFSDCFNAKNRIRLGIATEQDRALHTPNKPKPLE